MVEYSCGLLLIILVIFSIIKGIEMPRFLPYFVGGLGVLSFASAEFSRFLTRYKILEDKIVIISGIIKQVKKSIYFHPLGFVPDINVKQSRLQRIMGFGTVFIKQGGENSLEIKDVDNPHQILETIEDLIESNRVVTSRHQGQEQEEPLLG